jgi:uncharacterized Zn-binding protein involved in type VI secretion
MAIATTCQIPRDAGAGAAGDNAQIQSDAHGCPGCPDLGVEPAIVGSANLMMINGRPALRVDDVGIHAVCLRTEHVVRAIGAVNVFINGKAAYRKNDPSKHCGGSGNLIEGSDKMRSRRARRWRESRRQTPELGARPQGQDR